MTAPAVDDLEALVSQFSDTVAGLTRRCVALVAKELPGGNHVKVRPEQPFPDRQLRALLAQLRERYLN